MTRPQKITFAEMREQGVRAPLIYCFSRQSSARPLSLFAHVAVRTER
jgi:hypothetical protein